MNDTTKLVRIASGVVAILASVLLIATANMLIADYTHLFGQSMRTNALVVMAYFIIATAVISKLASVLLIANQKTKITAAVVIITQLALIALEIATMVLWTNISMAARVIDYIFMAVSIISILLSVVYLIRHARESDKQNFSYRGA